MIYLNYLALFLDCVFLFLASFIGSLCIFYYFTPYPYCLVYAFCVGCILAISATKFLTNKQAKKHVKAKEKKLYFDTLIRLNLMRADKIKNLFIKTFSSLDEQIIKRKDGFYLPQSKKLYVIKFGFDKVSKADIVRAFNQLRKDETAVFLAETFSQEITAFANRFNKRVSLLDGIEIFNTLKNKGILPTQDYTPYYTEKKKITFSGGILKRKNAKKFLLFGVAFCFMSFIVPYKTYYIICGALMMLFAIMLKLFGKQETPTTQG